MSANVCPLRTASTLQVPPAKEESRGKYVEASWFFHDRTVIISGRVDGDEVHCFAAETEDGDPFKVDDACMPDALADLIEAARLS